MDRRVNHLSEELVESLLSLASSFEGKHAPKSRAPQTPMDGLALLSKLEDVTRASFSAPSVPNLPAAAPAQSTAPAAAQHAAPARTAAPLPATRPAVFGSKVEQYQPALRDSSVVEALLQFHRQNLVKRSAGAPAPRSARAASSPSEPVTPPATGFAYAEIPLVRAVPKTDVLRRAAPGAHSILRPVKP